MDQVVAGTVRNIALLARTPADARDVMILGVSGLVRCSPKDFKPLYQTTLRKLTWPNGAEAHAYSAEAPNQMRGPQHDLGWADEASSFQDARKGDALDTAWNNLAFTLREQGHPRIAVTTTPKPNALTRVIRERAGKAISAWSTYDNKVNLAESFQRDVLALYQGTRIGRQEISGELLEDVEGALWTPTMISNVEDVIGKDTEGGDIFRDYTKLVVAVDPTGKDNGGADECGIVIVGKGEDGHGYALADWTRHFSPRGWADRVVEAYRTFKCDKIVAEGNYGGQMVVETIHAVDKSVPVEIVFASRGKRQRAEPVVALYEQGRIHHVGALPQLEDELLTWTPESNWSPGRMDALVWGVTWLNLAGGGQADAFHALALARRDETPLDAIHAAQEARERRGLLRKDRCPSPQNSNKHLYRGDLCALCGQVREAVNV